MKSGDDTDGIYVGAVDEKLIESTEIVGCTGIDVVILKSLIVGDDVKDKTGCVYVGAVPLIVTLFALEIDGATIDDGKLIAAIDDKVGALNTGVTKESILPTSEKSISAPDGGGIRTNESGVVYVGNVELT